MDWCLIESDPGVFGELVHRIGARGVAFTELYSLDVDELRRNEPIYGLIFLFKWRGGHSSSAVEVDENPPQDLFFASQVIHNACATQAVLSVLLNAEQEVELGETLQTLREFTLDFDAETKGMSISNSDIIRDAHNSFARPETIVLQSRPAQEDDDVFHFVAYVPRGGSVFELDGLQRGPINHGSFGDGHWLDVAVPAIQRKIASFASNEIKFNLMAVTKDPRIAISQRLEELRSSSTGAADEIAHLQRELEVEEAKVAEWRNDNIRRRHNYIPLVFALLKEVAAAKKLTEALEQAKKRAEAQK